MTDKREALKSMLNNLINDRQEEATLDLHSYMTAKMQEVSGLGAPAAPEADFELDTEDVSDDTEAE
jgi:hypothetical protein